jgi:excinuclease ABC subunit A
MHNDRLIIKGARVHNLKNIDLDLPRDALIVVSGLSGSGKSSLAFDTIYAEGQRRYVESLSAYARQFLGLMDKPDVDYIEGLSPAISIEQKTTNRNPRSTVGTITEIYDYFRLLYARIGVPHDPVTGERVEKQSIDQIIDAVLGLPAQSRITVLAPVVRAKKGFHQKIFEDARKAGYTRARVDGQMRGLEEEIVLEKQQKHTIEIVIDRLVVRPDNRTRIAESLEAALELAGGMVGLLVREPLAAAVDREAAAQAGDQAAEAAPAYAAADYGEEYERSYSEQYFYPSSETAFPELEPRLFSFNAPFGACPNCSGLGIRMEFDRNLIMPDPSLSYNEGGLIPYNPSAAWNRSKFEALAKHYHFSLDQPLGDLPEKIIGILFEGTGDKIEMTYVNKAQTGKFEFNAAWEGISHDLDRRYKESTSDGVKQWLEGFMSQRPCPACEGKRLRPEVLAVTIDGQSIHDVCGMSIRQSLPFFTALQGRLAGPDGEIATPILKEVVARLGFLASVGLEYLTLDRTAYTLSGGEAQRIRLATQIGSALVGVLYVLDEPSIGLHQRDNERLISTLLRLRDLGNTLVVVEHDEQTLRVADHIVDLGPGAGIHGGHVVASGTPAEVMANPASITGQYLAGTIKLEERPERRPGNGKYLTVRQAREHNLKGIDVTFPLGTLSVITGVSGSGKSTLLSDIIWPAVANSLNRTSHPVGACAGIDGIAHADKIINIDQSPIGRTPRSNPATYVGLFTAIRDLFANLPEAKARGFKPGRFSFNVKGGRCENCEGAGTIKIEMHFLPDVYVTCDVCQGRRFNRETLEVRYKGKNIHEVLELSIEEAREFFAPIPAVANKLQTLVDVGLGYIKLGQSALTLSGGEAQRVKLATELSKRSTGKTLYILDEPTTGLHFADVKKLMEVLHLLVDKGNSIILIEHNLDVISQADWIVDLGPEGGDLGGGLVASGRPEDIVACQASHTGRFLAEVLGRA